MMIIDKSRTSDRWIVLQEAEGKKTAVRILVAPVTKPVRRRAYAAAQAMFPDLVIDENADLNMVVEFSEEVGKALIREAARDWSGIFDTDGKKPLPFSRDMLDIALADEESGFFDSIDQKWLAPIRQRDAEKNGLSALPNGTGKAGTAGKTTATTRAASVGTKASGAKAAPTGQTCLKPSKLKPSGRR